MDPRPTPEELTAIKATAAARNAAINDNLPTWAQVEAALDGISNLTEAKVALKKIARVVYWLAKGKGE